jgi:hypothetical protein
MSTAESISDFVTFSGGTHRITFPLGPQVNNIGR